MLAEPAPLVEILEVTEGGRVLAVWPNCRTEHYWQVYFDVNRVIDAFTGTAG